jgi:hypothetical protein
VVFKVSFPKSLPKVALTNISQALASQKAADVDMTADETVQLKAFDEKRRNTQATGGQEAMSDDEDEDDGRNAGGQRVQCAQQ